MFKLNSFPVKSQELSRGAGISNGKFPGRDIRRLLRDAPDLVETVSLNPNQSPNCRSYPAELVSLTDNFLDVTYGDYFPDSVIYYTA